MSRRPSSPNVARWILMTFVALAVAFPTAVGARQDAGEQVLTGGFDVGPGGCPECFNPLQAGAGFTWLEKYFSTLVLYDVDYTALQGELAESWEASADGLEYTFTLREGVTWHDGEPFTSEDVAFTIELAKNPDSASWIGEKFIGVSEVQTPDPQTAVIVLEEPNAAIVDALTFLVMLPEHELADIPPAELVESDWWRTNPVGTGPFVFSEYASGQYVELVAYDDYWRGRPQLDRIVNRFFPEAGSAVLALRSGEIQFTYLTSDEAVDIEGTEGLQVIAGPSQVANYIGFDVTEERFADPRIRQAFMYAIDRAAIVEQLYGGQAQVIDCIFSNEAYVPEGTNDYAFDPEMAQQLLDEAGWADLTDGQPIEIITYYSDQLSNDVLVTMQQYLLDIARSTQPPSATRPRCPTPGPSSSAAAATAPTRTSRGRTSCRLRFLRRASTAGITTTRRWTSST
jgi:peptide/nickel transport system substrate-binding protein